MKKIILIIAIALVGFSASAQKIGVIAGLTGPNSALKDSEIGKFSMYHVGLVANFPVMEGVRLQPELIYKVKGCAAENFGGLKDVDFSAGFLEFGLEGQVGIGRDFLRAYGLVEPFIGYNLKDQGWDREKDPIENLSLSKTEYGLAIGGGVELFQFIQASVKYFWNMGTLEAKGEAIVNGEEVRNFNGMTFSVALLF